MLQVICGSFEVGHVSYLLGPKMIIGHPYCLSYNRRVGAYCFYGRIPFSYKKDRPLPRLG